MNTSEEVIVKISHCDSPNIIMRPVIPQREVLTSYQSREFLFTISYRENLPLLIDDIKCIITVQNYQSKTIARRR